MPQDRRFRLDTAYADDEWQRVLRAACDVLPMSQEEIEVRYADDFARDAVRRWPTWFEMSATARQFLERQPTIRCASPRSCRTC